MKAALVRIGIDHSYGHWNAPADPSSRRFVYVPIPESRSVRFHRGCKQVFTRIYPAVEQFAADFGLEPVTDLGWPQTLNHKAMHLDPDFETLTYGDVGNRRGSGLREMVRGDVIVFYAGLGSIRSDDTSLIYAIVGLYVVDEIVAACDVPPHRLDENAHTRKLKPGPSDIVVRAIPGQSGRLDRYLPIGEYRDRAYRVRRDLLKKWGGLSVNDGYIQRSAVPPRFLRPERFLDWFHGQDVGLLQTNNPELDNPRVIVVHLRQPRRNEPNERRDDPFWEFGSFGCTGCHGRNLMNPRRGDELIGARLAFAQGGPLGFRLVKLTPPVTVVHHADRIEVRWQPATMPFRYDAAPLLTDNTGNTDFPTLARLIAGINRSTWEARFSSRFRSNRSPVPDEVARELIRVVHLRERGAITSTLARSYDEALPYRPPNVDRARRRTYARLLSDCRTSQCQSRCKPKRRQRI